MAGFVRTVAAAGEKLNGPVVPETLYWRYDTLLYILHWPGVRLAPRVFVRRDVLRLGVIGRTRV